MPSLIRLLVFLVFMGLIVFGVMVSLTVFVDPGEREMTVRIPTRNIFTPDQQQPLTPDQILTPGQPILTPQEPVPAPEEPILTPEEPILTPQQPLP